MDALNLIFGLAVALVSFLCGFGVALLRPSGVQSVRVFVIVDEELLDRVRDANSEGKGLALGE